MVVLSCLFLAAMASTTPPAVAQATPDPPQGCPQFRCSAEHVGTSASSIDAGNVSQLTGSWSFRSRGRIYGSPSLADGILYVPSEDHNLYALDAESGEQLWAFGTEGAIWSTPAVAEETVYVGSADDHVYALDATTGELRFEVATGGDIAGSPALLDGVLYVGSNDHHVYALDATNGQVLWSYEAGDRVSSSPVVVDGVVYVGSNDHHLYAIDAATGEEVWRFEADAWIWSGPVVADGRVFFSSTGSVGSPASNGSGGNLYALEAATGRLLWTKTASSAFNSYASPVVVGDTVVSTGYTAIRAHDVGTGAQLWTRSASGYLFASPFVSNDVVFAVNSGRNGDGSLIALSLETGALLHQVSFRVLNYVHSSPIVAGGQVFFGDGAGVLHSLSLEPVPEVVEIQAEPSPGPLLPYSHRDVLADMLDPDSVAELRLPGDGVAKIAGSDDPRGLNIDFHNFKGLTEDGRRILMDVRGAGVVTDLMMYYNYVQMGWGAAGPPVCHKDVPENTIAAQMAMYIDNNPEPVFDMNAADFYCGEAGFPFIRPLTGMSGALGWTHLPIPFKERMLIVVTPASLDLRIYYDFYYTLFPDARGVETFDPVRDQELYQALIDLWGKPGESPRPVTPETKFERGIVTLAPGETASLLDLTQAGQVNSIRFNRFLALPPVVTTPTNDLDNDTRAAEPLKGVRLKARWDDRPNFDVDAPVGDFFGTGFGQPADFDSIVAGMRTLPAAWPQGWPHPTELSTHGKVAGVSTYAFWPMPFGRHGEVSLANTLPAGGASVLVDYEIEYVTSDQIRTDENGLLWRGDTELGYFHAREFYNRSAPVNSPHPERNENDGFARLRGRGNFAGVVLNMRTPTFGGTQVNDLSYMEGNCMFWIDGAPDYVPDMQTSGHEECFDAAGPYYQWNANNMTAGNTTRDACGAVWLCTYTTEISAFHWWVGDTISFHELFEATVEHGSENTFDGGSSGPGVLAEEAGVAFYYLAGNAPGEVTPPADSREVGRPRAPQADRKSE